MVLSTANSRGGEAIKSGREAPAAEHGTHNDGGDGGREDSEANPKVRAVFFARGCAIHYACCCGTAR